MVRVEQRKDGLFNVYHTEYGFIGCVDKEHLIRAIEIVNTNSLKMMDDFYKHLYR